MTILRIVVAAVVLLALTAAHAEEAAPGHGRKIAGLVLMTVGAAHLASSVGIGASFGIEDFQCHPPQCIEGGLGVALASGFLVAGGVLSAIGIPLYVVGKRQETRAALRRDR
jgi:hypothetical protein